MIFPWRPYARYISEEKNKAPREVFPICDRLGYYSKSWCLFPAFIRGGLSKRPLGIGPTEDVIMYICWSVRERFPLVWLAILRLLLSKHSQDVRSALYMMGCTKGAKAARRRLAQMPAKGYDDVTNLVTLLGIFFDVNEANLPKLALEISPITHKTIRSQIGKFCGRIVSRSWLVRLLRIVGYGG